MSQIIIPSKYMMDDKRGLEEGRRVVIGDAVYKVLRVRRRKSRKTTLVLREE